MTLLAVDLGSISPNSTDSSTTIKETITTIAEVSVVQQARSVAQKLLPVDKTNHR